MERNLGLHEKVVEGIESQGLKAAVFDKVVLYTIHICDKFLIFLSVTNIFSLVD